MIPQIIKSLANDIRTKITGKEVRESLAKGIEEAGDIADESNSRSKETEQRQVIVETQFDNVLAEWSDDLPVDNAETIAGRTNRETGESWTTIGSRLDEENRNAMVQLSQLAINVLNFGAVPDANFYNEEDKKWYSDSSYTTLATNNTLAITNAIKYARGNKVIFPNGNYFYDYIQLSGTLLGQHYATTNTLNLEAVGDVNLISNSFIGEEPPEGLGMEFGFTPSGFSLHGFHSITIDGLKFDGSLFDDFAKDSLPVTHNQGTINPYHTRTKAIFIGFSKNISLNNIHSRKSYGGVYLRDCENIDFENSTHEKSRQAFLLQNCKNVKMKNVKSIEARFAIDQPDGNAFPVYDRLSGNLLYTLNSNGISGMGLKTNRGYGFVIAGGRNITLETCISDMSGSDCFRIQDGPNGEELRNFKAINCESYYPARHAFSSYSQNVHDSDFVGCKAFYGSDNDVYDGQPPETLNEAMAGDTDYENYWALRLPNKTNVAFLSRGINVNYSNCRSVAKQDAFKEQRLRRYSPLRDGVTFSAHLQTRGGTVAYERCLFENKIDSSEGMVQYGGAPGDFARFFDNIISGLNTDKNDTQLYGIRNNVALGLSGNYHFRNNVVNGCRDGFYFNGDFNPEKWLSENDTVLNAFRSGVGFNANDITSKGIKFKDFAVEGDTPYVTNFTRRLTNILFENLSFDVTGDRPFNASDSSEEASTFRHLYIKEGNEYVMFVRAGTGEAAFHDNRWRLVDDIKINRVEYFGRTGNHEDNFKLLKTMFIKDFDAGEGTVDLAHIYDASNVKRNLRVRMQGGGTGLSSFLFTVDSSTIAGFYKVYYTPLKDKLFN